MSNTFLTTPLGKSSVALHVGAALGSALVPALWPWALGALVTNHVALTTAGLMPRSSLLGPNLTRLPAAAQGRREVAVTIDDGPDPEDTPRVLDLLDAANARASFFCIGARARAHPQLCREIVARGHQVENHTDVHSHAFSLWGPRRIREDISAAQATLSDITGQAPLFFRPTAGLRNVFLEPVLTELDLKLASWTRRAFDTRESRASRVLQRLTKDLGPGDILLMHDGHAARNAQGQAVILDALPRLLATLQANDLNTATLQELLL